MLTLAVEQPRAGFSRADVLFAMGKDPDLPTGDFAKTADVKGAWEIVRRHADAHLVEADEAFPLLVTEKRGIYLHFGFAWSSAADAERNATFILAEACLKYRVDVSISSLNWSGRLLYRGAVTNMAYIPSRLYIVAPTLFYILILAILVGLAMMNVALLGPRMTAQGLYASVMMLLFAALVYVARVRPALTRKANRVGLVDDHFVRVDAIPPAIEWQRTTEASEVRICNFTATCPICRSDVHLQNGRYEFRGRIIGCCIESPTEHVFSFDRVSLEGIALRQKPSRPEPRHKEEGVV